MCSLYPSAAKPRRLKYTLCRAVLVSLVLSRKADDHKHTECGMCSYPATAGRTDIACIIVIPEGGMHGFCHLTTVKEVQSVYW